MPQDLISPTTQDRLLAALRSIIREEFPQLTYLGVWDYVITAVGDGTVDCSPGVDTEIPIGDLTKVPIRTGVDGLTVTLPPATIGRHCIVAFVNADPTRPVCLSIDSFPGAVLPVARMTDPVVAGPFAGTITGPCSTVVKTQ